MLTGIALHSTAVKHASLTKQIKIAQTLGYDCLEITRDKIFDYLADGYTEADLQALTADLKIAGVGWVADAERTGSDWNTLVQQAREVFHIANLVHAESVQLLTGPIDVNAVLAHHDGTPYQGYQATLDLPEEQRIEQLANNVGKLADIAAEYDLCVYLEPLGWASVNSAVQGAKAVELANRENAGVLIDFFHCYAAGDTPKDIAKLNAKYIRGIHISDSLPCAPDEIAIESVIRNVALGDGVLNLEKWISAVRATGYDGWWCSEVFGRKLYQQDPTQVSAHLLKQMQSLLGAG